MNNQLIVRAHSNAVRVYLSSVFGLVAKISITYSSTFEWVWIRIFLSTFSSCKRVNDYEFVYIAVTAFVDRLKLEIASSLQQCHILDSYRDILKWFSSILSDIFAALVLKREKKVT